VTLEIPIAENDGVLLLMIILGRSGHTLYKHKVNFDDVDDDHE
jgi:hypothetical protein